MGRRRKNECGNAAASEFLFALDALGLGFLLNSLMNAGYRLDTMDLLTKSDLMKLRVTDTSTQKQLLGLGDIIRKEKMRGGSDGGAVSPPASTCEQPADPSQPLYSATVSTANEYCRIATVFLEHHHVSKPWPREGSLLARGLGLSYATPPPSRDELYAIQVSHDRQSSPPRLTERSVSPSATPRARALTPPRSPHPPAAATATAPKWNLAYQPPRPHPPAADGLAAAYVAAAPKQTAFVERPKVHIHSNAAKHCNACFEQLCNIAGGCIHWQYQVSEEITTGDGEHMRIPVWKPFPSVESLRLEHAYRKQQPGLKIGGKYAKFATMRWGPHLIRRAEAAAVPFPTLHEREVVPLPQPQVEVKREQEVKMAGLFQRLEIAEEEKQRFLIHLQQASEYAKLLAEREKERREIMLRHFARQRALLEEEEREVRRSIEDTFYELDIEKIWQQVVDSVAAKNAAAKKAKAKQVERGGGPTFEMRDNAEDVVGEQCKLMHDMEATERAEVEAQEEAAWRNLTNLFLRFNGQVKSMLKNKTKKLVASNECRCEICRRKDCEFFQHPWKGHWRHIGGALDLKPPSVGMGTIAALFGRASEVEYEEFLNSKRKIHFDRVFRPAPPSPPRAASPRCANVAGNRRDETPNCAAEEHSTRAQSAPRGRRDVPRTPRPPFK